MLNHTSMIHGSQFWEEEIFSSKGSYKLSAESFKLHESAFLWESDCLSKSVPKKKIKKLLFPSLNLISSISVCPCTAAADPLSCHPAHPSLYSPPSTPLGEIKGSLSLKGGRWNMEILKRRGWSGVWGEKKELKWLAWERQSCSGERSAVDDA